MRRTLLAVTGIAAVGLLAPAAWATGPSATISGTAGENVSTTDGYDGRHLRYVGDPAPDGYSPWYQWGSPYILTESPEDGPVTMRGALDVSDMTEAGQVAVIGLHDADALMAGDRGDKAAVGIYVAFDGTYYTVGVTDGDAGGGENVQRFVRLSPGDLADGMLNVRFTVDGTLDPADCASDAADAATADGCMTLDVNGQTVTDSYGTIVPTDIVVETELGSGAHPGWDTSYNAGDGPDVGVDFDLAVSPVLTAPRTAEGCKDGGFAAFEFKNQGLCVATVQANDAARREG
ncbi:hypothetical protein [Ornithinimicrobium sediminis]|uniref:hypothetical protein n=1 Tax=Ornithinimicrobium sediminis TaxID=2904603 RepID=UPI001E43D6BE|nr:hypothetical protein [Ornithinimicrobium sediminis]MCE0486511.1 hypothetical protein [Ornithinimicrobium sediminis]